MDTFMQLMNKRRALNEAIQFETPGSPEYLKLIQQVNDIDAIKFKRRPQNTIKKL